MERFATGSSSTTLNGAINSSTTTIVVTSAASLPSSGNFRVRIDDEIILVTNVSGNTLTGIRGQEDTANVAHANGAAVNVYLTKGALLQYRKDSFGYGPFASLPVTVEKGMCYQCSDAPYLLYYNGSAWEYYGPIFPLSIPVLADYTWINQGATAFTNQTLIPPVASALQLRALVKTAPATPYTIESLWTMQESRDIINEYWGAGILVRDSVSGKIIVYGAINRDATGFLMSIMKWDDATTYNSAQSEIYPIVSFPMKQIWWRIRDNGTNRYYEFSADKQNYITLHSTLRTDFLTPNQVGFCLIQGHATKAPEATFLHIA